MKSIENFKVLVVDDEPLVLRVIVRMLEKFGFTEIDTAENGEQGIIKVDRNAYDLIFTDIVMSNLSGAQVLEHIRKINNSIPVIGMSGTPWLLTDQFDAVLSKPFTQSELIEIIGKMNIKPPYSNSKEESFEQEKPRNNPLSSSQNYNRFSNFSLNLMNIFTGNGFNLAAS